MFPTPFSACLSPLLAQEATKREARLPPRIRKLLNDNVDDGRPLSVQMADRGVGTVQVSDTSSNTLRVTTNVIIGPERCFPRQCCEKHYQTGIPCKHLCALAR